MIFGRNGKFELVEGSRSTTLTFSRLGSVLPLSSNPSPDIGSLVETAGVILIDGTSLLLEACRFSSISSDARKGLITGSGNCEITLKDTVFANCETRNGHMLEMTRPKSVEISGACTFEGCTSTEGDGEALCCVLEGEGSLVMNKTSIVPCGVNAVNGRGGGIYLDLKESVDAYLFSGLTFGGNVTFEVKDMFVRSADLNASIIPSLVGTAGIDFIGCGKAETPCHWLWRGISNLQASEDSRSCFVKVLDEVAIDECYEFVLSQLSIGLPAAAASPAFAELSISQTTDGSSQ
ncbi:uncharacterized protein MONOS_8819 [Monocercomonoides exilis]|uniref:uncharacterized protein n=1 Tax=Monocercomonoides exilis TaxID=2049356 RepID=UPI0035597D9F|nr:hypothetical protein MONOS_8819 [Monocercomonoides exilis]|eukprot:MONOS_8819.1-p1 / transcript=MONOS_8819.1 / gene=MONOS_8819 / organism=Monocercomonoides_exilis_PA203 / gene_product=unspecified product / transcript_product=unspecified product / location=Mono_scaffold00343:50236-51385(+) / protein_length=292 / sequence_SO=supercontig / SO=protein_coding / is_pseudo=false